MTRPDAGWTPPEPAAIAAALTHAGLRVSREALEVLARDDRFAVRLPGDRMAWFPTNAEGLARLDRERRVLTLVGRHCGFAAPRILQVADAGWDLRALVPGPSAPFEIYRRVKAERDFARTVGAGLGAILAELHTAIPAAALAGGWLPPRPSWPPPIAWAEARLPRVTEDRPLISRALALLARCETEEMRARARALVHTDLGFHNVVIDPATGAVAGVFDFDGAAWCDPHHDFRYLLLDDPAETLLEAALAVYEPATGARIDRGRVRLINAACAVAFLALRAGAAADEAPAGRTLAEDLAWTSMALERVER